MDEMRDIDRVVKLMWSDLVAENEDNEALKMDRQGLDYFNSMFYEKYGCAEAN